MKLLLQWHTIWALGHKSYLFWLCRSELATIVHIAAAILCQKMLYIVYGDMHSVQFCTLCMVTCTVFNAVHCVWWHARCSILYTVYDDMHSVQCCTLCMVTCTVFNAVHCLWWHSQCSMLYTVYGDMHSVQCCTLFMGTCPVYSPVHDLW